MHGHLLGSRRAPHSQIPKHRFLAGQRFFLRDGVPLAAFCKNRILHVLPNHQRAGRGERQILLRFVFLLFFGELRGQVLLRRLPRGLIHGRAPPLSEAFYTTPNSKPLAIWQARREWSLAEKKRRGSHFSTFSSTPHRGAPAFTASLTSAASSAPVPGKTNSASRPPSFISLTPDGWQHQTADHFQGGGFAGAVRAD